MLYDGYYKINKSDFDSFNTSAVAAELGRGNPMELYSEAYDDATDTARCWVKVEKNYTVKNMTDEERLLIMSTEDATTAGMILPEVEA